MKNLLFSAAIGDISGMPYEFNANKDYRSIVLVRSDNDYTDDTVCTFACAEALLNNIDVAQNLWQRCRGDIKRGYGSGFRKWIKADTLQPPYQSFGNGSAMRASSAGFLATSVEECTHLATLLAAPTHDHPEGIKGSVATALAVFYAVQGHDKDFIRANVLDKFYPEWTNRSYYSIKETYAFEVTCQKSVPPALISFLESTDYQDCLLLTIALGGDADTLAAISGPVAYAYYRFMPQYLINNALIKLPKWMLELNEDFDERCSGNFKERVAAK